MGCSSLDLACQVSDSLFRNLVEPIGQAAGEAVAGAMTLWVTSDTVSPDNSGVVRSQQYTVPVAATILACSAMVQFARMALTRKREPALDVGLGLLRYLVVSTIGIGVLAGALKAGDAFTEAVLAQSIAGYTERMKGLFGLSTINSVGLLPIVLALLALLLGLLQWFLMLFREAGLMVLAAVISLAASGGMNRSTKPWLPRAGGWTVALVTYKPMAGLIYAIGFELMGAGQSVVDMLTALLVMLTAVIAMPAMMRFFAWSGVSSTGGSGAAGVLAGGALGAVSLAALRRGGGAGDTAAQLNRGLPEAGGRGGGSGGGGGGDGPPPAGPLGPTGAGGGSTRTASAAPAGPAASSGGVGAPGQASAPSGPAAARSSGAGGATGSAGGAAGAGATGGGGAAGGAAAAAGPVGAAVAAAAVAVSAAGRVADGAISSTTTPPPGAGSSPQGAGS